MSKTPRKLHQKNNNIQSASECMNPKSAKGASLVRLAIMQWEERWKAMLSDLSGDVKIPGLWRMSALLEICSKDVK